MSTVLSLSRVPRPSEFEAPSAWVSRLALHQGGSIAETMQFLGYRLTDFSGRRGTGDFDLQMDAMALASLRDKCGLPKTAFAATEMAMEKLRGRQGKFLMTTAGHGQKFRYCPACLGRQAQPYFDIRWRFLRWRHCPVHNHPMMDQCWTCRFQFHHPKDLATCEAGKWGFASPRRCLRCCVDLAAMPALGEHPFTWINGVDLQAVNRIEQLFGQPTWPTWPFVEWRPPDPSVPSWKGRKRFRLRREFHGPMP